MADYSINAVTRRVVYTGSAGVGPYAFSFEVLAQTDIAVYKNAVKLTLTTNYTVTINANGTGSVTLVSAATGTDKITIIGSRAIERTTDFVTAGDLLASSLNEQLDSQIVMIQQLAEENRRSLKAPAYDPAATEDGGTLNMTLPPVATRAGNVLAFDASGNPIATEHIGEFKGNWAAATAYLPRDIVKDGSNSNSYICVTAHTASGTTPISSNADVAKWALLVDAASTATSASAAATSATAAATSATNAASSATTASTQASNAATSATSASGSASTASTQATAAAGSASAASTSATNAAASAAAAVTSAASVGFTATSTTTFQNKTLDNTNAITVKDANFTIQDDGDTTKILKIQASGISTGTTRTLTSQDADLTIAGINVNQSFSKAQRGAVTALTDGATITPDLSAANNYSLTLGGNRTLANPTNITAGQSGAIVISQDGTGSRTLAYGSYWKFPGGTAPTLTVTASAVDVLVYYVESATRITARVLSDVK
jgi:hypothetical protein